MHVGLCLELQEGGCVLIGDVTRNIERRSRYHCCRDKAIYILDYMSVALVIQHALRRVPYYSAICGLVDSATFSPHYLTNGTIFFWGGEGGSIEHKMCVSTFSTMLP
jgi:hypothetical protein